MLGHEITREIVRKYKAQLRLLLVSNEYSTWAKSIFSPSPSYIEGPGGPYRMREIKLLEINPKVIIKLGRLIPEKEVDYTNNIADICP